MATVRTFNANPHSLHEIHRALRAIKVLLPPSTFDATTDPGSGDDITEGWKVGSVWINTASSDGPIIWQCADNTQSAAVWNRMVAVPSTDGGVAGTPRGYILATNANGSWVPFAAGADGLSLHANIAQNEGVEWRLPGEISIASRFESSEQTA